MAKQPANEPRPKKREFVDIPTIDESWDDMYFHMEGRYPKGIILHAEDKKRAESLRSTALVMGKRLCYAISTSIEEQESEYLIYIWQL